MILTNDPSLSLVSQRIESDLKAFLAAGGQIEPIPVGAMAETGWSGRQLINPQVHTKAMRETELAEREARKLARQSVPAPAGTERNPPRTVVKVPRVNNGPRIAQPGTQKARILELLAAGECRAVKLAEAMGISVNATCVHLAALRKAKLVTSTGRRGNLRWSRT